LAKLGLRFKAVEKTGTLATVAAIGDGILDGIAA
jgi:hypothetical protein